MCDFNLVFVSVFMSVLSENPIQQANIDIVKETRLKCLCISNTWEVSANLETVWTVGLRVEKVVSLVYSCLARCDAEFLC